mmetsp:Transcript_217/g.628  ORF Transcript_217/g.628 Transcript_217/m.628 type:complete len:212 (-) Transcript_217:13-648(-)
MRFMASGFLRTLASRSALSDCRILSSGSSLTRTNSSLADPVLDSSHVEPTAFLELRRSRSLLCCVGTYSFPSLYSSAASALAMAEPGPSYIHSSFCFGSVTRPWSFWSRRSSSISRSSSICFFSSPSRFSSSSRFCSASHTFSTFLTVAVCHGFLARKANDMSAGHQAQRRDLHGSESRRGGAVNARSAVSPGGHNTPRPSLQRRRRLRPA